MHLIDQRVLGVVILLLLGVLVSIKRHATASILDRPRGSPVVQLVNIFNLLFLLIVNPLAAILLLLGKLSAIDPTHVTMKQPWILLPLESLGLVLYVAGHVVMAWALITLGHNYQPGGGTPRYGERMAVGGPYRFVRHPMYTAALSLSLGLACLIQSWAVLLVFAIYLGLLFLLIPLEEDGLREAYGEQYEAYQREVHKLVPFMG